jgi:hypothetical protein
MVWPWNEGRWETMFRVTGLLTRAPTNERVGGWTRAQQWFVLEPCSKTSAIRAVHGLQSVPAAVLTIPVLAWLGNFRVHISFKSRKRTATKLLIIFFLLTNCGRAPSRVVRLTLNTLVLCRLPFRVFTLCPWGSAESWLQPDGYLPIVRCY